MELQRFPQFDKDPFFSGFPRDMLPARDPFFNNFMRLDKGDNFFPLRKDEDWMFPANQLRLFGSEDVNDMFRRMMAWHKNMMPNWPIDMENCHSIMHSAYRRFHRIGDNESDVYEAYKSKRAAPGKISEEMDAVRDSRRKLEKMRVKRRIKDREHAIEKTHHTDTGDVQQNQHLSGFTEDGLEAFWRDWNELTAALPHWLNWHHPPPCIKDSTKDKLRFKEDWKQIAPWSKM